MGKKLRNLLKRKNKKKEQKKGKIAIGEIKVLFETGTSGPYSSSVPTTSGYAGPHTITPKPLDSHGGSSGQEELLQESNPPESSEKQEKKKKGPSLQDRSGELTDRLNEMIEQLTAMETSMEEEDKRRTLHPLGEKKDMSSVEKEEAMPLADRRRAIKRDIIVASNSATNLPRVQDINSQLDMRQSPPQIGCGAEVSKPTEDTGKAEEIESARAEGTGADKCQTCHDYPTLQKRNTQLENLLSRCLTVFEYKRAVLQEPMEVQLAQEIRQALGTDEKNSLTLEPKTRYHAPAFLKLDSWDDILAKRLEARKNSPWGRYLLSKEASKTSLARSKIPDDDEDSDEESFVSASSSLTSLNRASDSGPLNIPQMELLERPFSTSRGQQTQECSRIRSPEVQEKLRQVVKEFNDLACSWSVPPTIQYNATIPSSPPQRENNPLASTLHTKLTTNHLQLPLKHFRAIDASDIQTAPPPSPVLPEYADYSVPSRKLFDESLTYGFKQLSSSAYSSSSNSSEDAYTFYDALAPHAFI